MRVTDPNAIKTLIHPTDASAEFDVSACIPRDERMKLAQELQDIAGEGKGVTVEKIQGFYDRIVKKYLREIRGVEDADGRAVTLSGNAEQVVKILREIRLSDSDNVALWLGQEIYSLNVLTEEEKKRLGLSLTSSSTNKTDQG